MIQLKDNTVNIHGISNELLFAMFVTDAVLNRYGSVLVITSINDGKHSSGSLHYSGNAFDFRTWYIVDKEEEVMDDLREALRDSYDVVLEDDHIHVEYQPKTHK